MSNCVGHSGGMNNRSVRQLRIQRPAGFFALKPGATAKVRNCPGAYQLPAGLKEGDTIKILGFEGGYYTAEKAGLQFSVFMANLRGPWRIL